MLPSVQEFLHHKYHIIFLVNKLQQHKSYLCYFLHNILAYWYWTIYLFEITNDLSHQLMIILFLYNWLEVVYQEELNQLTQMDNPSLEWKLKKTNEWELMFFVLVDNMTNCDGFSFQWPLSSAIFNALPVLLCWVTHYKR